MTEVTFYIIIINADELQIINADVLYEIFLKFMDLKKVLKDKNDENVEKLL